MSNTSSTRSRSSKTGRGQTRRATIFRKPAVAQKQSTEQSGVTSAQAQVAHQNAKQKLAGQGLKIQAKLKIGSPNDKMEREADSVADRVMSMPGKEAAKPANSGGPGIQRKAGSNEELNQKPIISRMPEGDEGKIGAKEQAGQTPALSTNTESQINSMRGGGQPMEKSERSFFEPRFGRDFSTIRMHTGPKAAEASRDINARAFTVGNDMFFGAGEYQPGSQTGRKLMAHELTHTVQQEGRTSTSNQIRRERRKPIPYKKFVKGKLRIRKTHPTHFHSEEKSSLLKSSSPLLGYYIYWDRIGRDKFRADKLEIREYSVDEWHTILRQKPSTGTIFNYTMLAAYMSLAVDERAIGLTGGYFQRINKISENGKMALMRAMLREHKKRFRFMAHQSTLLPDYIAKYSAIATMKETMRTKGNVVQNTASKNVIDYVSSDGEYTSHLSDEEEKNIETWIANLTVAISIILWQWGRKHKRYGGYHKRGLYTKYSRGFDKSLGLLKRAFIELGAKQKAHEALIQKIVSGVVAVGATKLPPVVAAILQPIIVDTVMGYFKHQSVVDRTSIAEAGLQNMVTRLANEKLISQTFSNDIFSKASEIT